MKRILLTIIAAAAAALTGAADAAKFDTSKMSVDDKNTLMAVISNYYRVHCVQDHPYNHGVLPKIKIFYDQLLSEVDVTSAAVAETKQAVEQEYRRFSGHWCAWATKHLQDWNDHLVELPPPPPPPPEPEPPPPPPPPVNLAYTVEGQTAFLSISLQRHATLCPAARSQAFELARSAVLARLAWAEGLRDWANDKFEQDVRPLFATGLSGQWCRGMTAVITAQQRAMFE